MYAIIQTGGKQYRVGLGDVLRVEKLAGDVGETVTLDNVLLVASGEEFQVGQPLVAGAQVTGQILTPGQSQKNPGLQKEAAEKFSASARSSAALHCFADQGYSAIINVRLWQKPCLHPECCKG